MESISLTPPVEEYYGLEFLKKVPGQLTRELICYGITRGHYGAVKRKEAGITGLNSNLASPFQHMVNLFRILLDGEIVLENGIYRNNNALEIIEALCTEDDVGIVGNASSGKTAILAGFCDLDWMAAPQCTTALIGTTTLESSEDRLWGQASHLYRCAIKKAKELHGPGATVGTLVDYKKTIVYGDISSKDEERSYKNAIKAIAFPPGSEGKNALATTRGRKNERFRVYLDEFAEMEPDVPKIRANLSANSDLLFAAAANPTNSANNPHKELCQPSDPKEWESVNKDMKRWNTRTGVCIFLSGERSPNLGIPDESNPPFPFLLTRAKEQKILRSCYGNTNSLEYWRNAVGFWPGTEIENTVLTRSLIGASRTNLIPSWGIKPLRIICGFDTGFTQGGDRCAATFFRMGEENQILEVDGRKVSYEPRTVIQYLSTKEFQAEVNQVFEFSIASQVVDTCIAMGVKPCDFGMDVSGDGGKMLQAIMVEWLKVDSSAGEIHAISSMGSATERVVSSLNPKKCEDVYDRLVTEYWFAIRNALEAEVLYGLDLNAHRELITELCSRLYEHKGKKVSVETKRDMKARIRKSPDLADSLVYALEMCRRAGLEFVSPTEPDVSEAMRYLERRYFEGKEDRVSDEEFSYASESVDPDGF